MKSVGCGDDDDDNDDGKAVDIEQKNCLSCTEYYICWNRNVFGER